MRAAEEFGRLVGALGRRWESLQAVGELAGEHKFLTSQNTMYSFPSAPSDAEQPLQTVHSPASFSDVELSLLKEQGVTKITPECVCVH